MQEILIERVEKGTEVFFRIKSFPDGKDIYCFDLNLTRSPLTEIPGWLICDTIALLLAKVKKFDLISFRSDILSAFSLKDQHPAVRAATFWSEKLPSVGTAKAREIFSRFDISARFEERYEKGGD